RGAGGGCAHGRRARARPRPRSAAVTGRPRFVASLLLLLTFVVGGMAGMALEEALGLDWFDFLDEDNRPEQGQLLAGLQLTPGQRDRIDDILDVQEERLE